MAVAVEKPPYLIPSMAKIEAVPSNGLTIMSTFSGCGGSCLGFRMAGYRPLLAVEFIDAAADSYRANHPGVPVYQGDIRELTADHAFALAGVMVGEIDVLEGSPPCESFSTSGKLSRGWGQQRNYSDGKMQRMDDLFYEFIRLLGGIQPRAFVAENVSGLAKGVSKGYFKLIHAAFAAEGYRVAARMLDAQWLGVPQRRKRVIFVGIRDDLRLDPVFPTPLPYRYSIRDAIDENIDHIVGGWPRRQMSAHEQAATIGKGGYSASGEHEIIERDDIENGQLLSDRTRHEWEQLRPGESHEKHFSLKRAHANMPSPTIVRQDGKMSHAVSHPSVPRKFSIPELRRLCGFPDDFQLTGSYSQQWERLGNSVPPPMMHAVARELMRVLI